MFKVFKNTNERELEIFLDISKLFPADEDNNHPNSTALKEIKKKFMGMVRRGLPVHLKRIVHTNYPFSEEIALAAESILNQYNNSMGSCSVPSRELRNIAPPQPETASLVVTACLDDAHELMSINRDLRAIQPLGNTTYITPVFRSNSKNERNRIKSSLTYGESGPNTFNLYSLIEIDLPDCAKNHSWISELESLNQIVEWADQNEINVPKEINDRINLLQNAPSQGISDKLFWASPKGLELKIRPDFTLINTSDGNRDISQADVYTAVSALLLSLRNGVKNKASLSHKPYEWSVLSPDNFERFNDGVIQASLLRASRNHEFNYSSDEKLSIRVKDLVLDQINNLNNGIEDGEALMEFLIAILLGKLVLIESHTEQICQEVCSAKILPAQFHLISNYIMNN